jgi:hypothetical protein
MVFHTTRAVPLLSHCTDPRDFPEVANRLKIEHLLESGREPLDERRLEVILQKHGLEGRWKKFLAGRG